MASFSDLLRVLDKKVPNEPTLFEFYLNVPLLEEFSGKKTCNRLRSHLELGIDHSGV